MKWSIVACVVVVSAPALAQRISIPDVGSVCATARTRASLSPDGAWLPKHAALDHVLHVYKDEGERLQIVEELSGVNLVLHVDRATLCTVAVDDIDLFPSVKAAQQPLDSTLPGMQLSAGTRLERRAAAGGDLVQVQMRDETIQIVGYVKASKLGMIYRGRGTGGVTEMADALLPRSFRLLDAPGGAPFATSTNRKRVGVHVVLHDGKFSLVRMYAHAFGWVVGWISSSQVQPIPASERGFADTPFVRIRKTTCPPGSVDSGGGCSPDPANTLREGAPLFDAIDGRLVGTVTSYFRHRPAHADRGWHQYDIATRFGVVQLWAQPGDPPLSPAPVAADQPAGADGDEPLMGVVAAPPPLPTPPPPSPPENVAPSVLEVSRIRGSRHVVPDPATLDEIKRSGKTKIVATFKFCIEVSGAVSRSTQLKSSGFPAYDRDIQRAISTWAYRPYLVNGVAKAACSTATFVLDPSDAGLARP